MLTLLGLAHRVRTFFRREAADAETAEELRDHIVRQSQKHMAEGMTPNDAERLARIELGGIERFRGETAEARSGLFAESLVADCRYALHRLKRRPTFLLVVLLTLGLGLGAGSVIFTVIDGALYKRLPYPNAGRLMTVALRMPNGQHEMDMVWSFPKFALFRSAQTVFDDLALHSSETLSIYSADGTDRVSGETVSAAYFSILGARAARGRVFVAAEDEIGNNHDVVIVSDAYWKTTLGANADVLRSTIDIAGTKRAVVGVMPPGFAGLSGDTEMWIPIPAARSAAILAMADAHNLGLIARLRPGIAPHAAQEAVARIGSQIDAAYPAPDGHWGAAAQLLNDVRVAPAIRRALQLLGAIVVLMLLMVCVNLTTLYLTRVVARQGEFAVRIALGAYRRRVVQQVIVESLIMTGAGALAGMVAGFSALRWITLAISTAVPASGPQTQLTRVSFSLISFDGKVVWLTIAMALAIGTSIGVITALRATGGVMMDALRRSANAVSPANRGALVIAQVAIALLFLVVSGLTVDSLRRVLQVPLGFQPARLTSVKVTLDQRRVTGETPRAMWESVAREVGAVPGVTSVAIGSCAPIGMHCDGTGITPLGHSGEGHVMYLEVSPRYFSTLGTTLIRGRDFESGDTLPNERVMIINRAAAHTIWGSDDPLQTPVVSGDSRTRVIGIVEDARYEDMEQAARPAIFVPQTQSRLSRGVVFIRANTDAGGLNELVRQAIRRAGTGHALGDVRVMTERLHDAVARNRLIATMVSVFALVAVALAALGVYGTLSLVVLQRSKEFAIRRALGAGRVSLVRMVVAHTSTLAAMGCVVGLLLAWIVARAIAALLYDTRPLQPGVYAISVFVLLVAMAAAATVPSIRSARVNPRDAMRGD